MLTIPGLIAPNEIQDEMLDSQMVNLALETNSGVGVDEGLYNRSY